MENTFFYQKRDDGLIEAVFMNERGVLTAIPGKDSMEEFDSSVTKMTT